MVGNDFHDFIDAAADENVIAVAFFHEAFFFPCIDEGEEGIVEAVDVRNDDGRTFPFSVNAQVAYGIGEFFQRARASGKGDEGMAGSYHDFLSFDHVGDFDELCDAAVCLFLQDEDFGNDADDFAACCHGCVSDDAHEADSAAAVCDGATALGNGFSEFSGKGCIGEFGSEVRAAVYDDIFQFHNEFLS